MRKLTLLCSICAICGALGAAQVTFEWDASPEPVLGYRVYVSTNSPSGWTNGWTVDTRSTNCFAVITNILAGTVLRAYATAYNEQVESEPSNDVNYTVPLAGPRTLRIKPRLETTGLLDCEPWRLLTDLTEVEVPIVDTAFYRIRMEVE